MSEESEEDATGGKITKIYTTRREEVTRQRGRIKKETIEKCQGKRGGESESEGTDDKKTERRAEDKMGWRDM